MKYRKKPVTIEAITFDQLVDHGKTHGGNIVEGFPWSFSYQGNPITHENNDCYLIPTLEGSMRFNRGDMLITGVKGEIYPCKADIFAATYEPAAGAPLTPHGQETAMLAVMNAVVSWWSENHGDHEGGSIAECNRCRIRASMEIILSLWQEEAKR